MQEWNGYTFEQFNLDAKDHCWNIIGVQPDTTEINIFVLGIGATNVSLYSTNGITIWHGGVVKFQINDVIDTPVVVKGVNCATREDVMFNLYEGFE